MFMSSILLKKESKRRCQKEEKEEIGPVVRCVHRQRCGCATVAVRVGPPFVAGALLWRQRDDRRAMSRLLNFDQPCLFQPRQSSALLPLCHPLPGAQLVIAV